MTDDGLRRRSCAPTERRLQAAMLAGDVAELDRLLDDRLVATLMPDLEVVSKEEDLAAHRAEELVLTELVEEELTLVTAGSTGVTGACSGSRGRATASLPGPHALHTDVGARRIRLARARRTHQPGRRGDA